MQGARLTAGHRRRSFFFTTFETLTTNKFGKKEGRFTVISVKRPTFHRTRSNLLQAQQGYVTR
jgi:hypothetical protein